MINKKHLFVPLGHYTNAVVNHNPFFCPPAMISPQGTRQLCLCVCTSADTKNNIK